MIAFKLTGKLTAINADREDVNHVTFRVLPEHNAGDFYPQGVSPAQVILHGTPAMIQGVQFGEVVTVEGNLSFGVQVRKDNNNPNKTWENYRTHFAVRTIKKG